MSEKRPAPALIESLYRRYLDDQDTAALVRQVARHYTSGTLERLLGHSSRVARRGAALALGYLGGYECNAALGRALLDDDRGVRMMADNSLRAVWRRAGNEAQQHLLGVVMRLNTARLYGEAAETASQLIAEAPWFAEAWNQRAIAFCQLRRYTDAIHDCQQALEINPYHFGAAAGMGHCYLQLGNRPAALECFRRALNLNPDLESVRTQVVRLERRMRQ